MPFLLILRNVFKAIPWWAYLVAGLLLAAFLYGESRYRAGQAERQALWDAASTAAAQEARATEDGWRKGITDYATKATQERLAREQETARIIDGLRTGAVSVRPRFRCPVSATPRPTPGDDGSPTGSKEPSGLQESDAVVLLRTGDDADAVSERLVQCQHFVRTLKNGDGG